MKQFIKRWAGMMVFAALLAGCGATAHVEKDDTVNFSRYKTYAWSEREDSAGQKINSLTQQQVKQAVNAELSKQGWKQVSRKPDLLLNYDVLVERNTVKQSDPVYSDPFTRTFYNPYRRRFYSVYYPSQFLGYNDYQTSVKEGTITITMTDAATDKTVWQGWSTNEIDHKNLTQKEVQESVKAIFRKFEVASR